MTELDLLRTENDTLRTEIGDLLIKLFKLRNELDTHRADIVYLLKTLLNLQHQYPDLELPELTPERFDNGIWARAVAG